MSKVLKLLRPSKKHRKKEQVLATSTSTPPSAPSLSTSTLATVQTTASTSQPIVSESEKHVSTSPSTVIAVTPTEKEGVSKTSSATRLEERTKIHDRTLKVMGPLIDVFNLAKNASEAAGDVSGPLKAAFGVSEKLLTMLRAVVENDKAWEELAAEVEDHQGALDQHKEMIEKNKQVSYLTPPTDDFIGAVDDYAKVLIRIAEEIIEGGDRFNKKKAKSYFKQIPTTRIQADTIRRLREELHRSWNFLQGRINLLVMRSTRRVEEHVAHIRISQTLQVASARGDTVGKLLKGTRTAILEKITTWADDAISQKQIFWLCDGPGTGKSTIAAHTSSLWKEQGRLAGVFFFSKEDEHTRDLGRFCATVAKQAIEMHPIGQRYIIDLAHDPSFLPFVEKFDLLIRGLVEYLVAKRKTPKSSSDTATPDPPEPTSFIIVIDSLDQCDEYDQSRLLDALLHRLPPTASAKVFITSTLLQDTRHPFQTSQLVLKSEVYDHLSISSRKDVELYVRGQLRSILSEHQQDQVIDAANGVFQLAFVACASLKQMIHKATILKQLANTKPDPTFRELYSSILEEIKGDSWVGDEEINAYRTVLQAVVLAHRPVTISTHHAFLPQMDVVPDYVQKIISRFAGIVKIGSDKEDGLVFILHPTFRAYLLSLDKGDSFNIAPSAGHAHMANGCLKLLDQLEYDLCKVVQDHGHPLPVSNPLELPEIVTARFGTDNSTPLRYAVVFWARHAAEGLEHEDMRAKILPFFHTKLLMWIEWASTIRELPECIIGLEELSKHLEVQASLSSISTDVSTFNWCQDALRFFKLHKSMLDQSSMQAYYSALAFDPPGSLVSSHYQPTAAHSPPIVTGHSDPVIDAAITAIAFSRDGDVIATAGDDFFIRLWDGTTRESLEVHFEGQRANISCLAFSSDGSLLGSGSTDGSIIVSRVDKGRHSGSNQVLLSGIGTQVACLSFSEDDKRVVSGYADGTIGVWSIIEKRCLSLYTIPALTSTGDEESPDASNEASEPIHSFISLSRDQQTIAICQGQRLRLFSIVGSNIVEFVTIRYGRPAQPVFSFVLSTRATSDGDYEYLYWGGWILDMKNYQRDQHRFLSRISTAEVQLSSQLDSAGPITRPASLLYAAKSPGRINSYRMANDEGLLLLPLDVDISCWVAVGTRIVIGSVDGRVILVQFKDWSILGKESQDLVGRPDSDTGYATASDGAGDDDEADTSSVDFMTAIEGPMSRRGSAV